MSQEFKVQEDDKRLLITGPTDLVVSIDYDDVWHAQVMRDARKLCRILNAHWNEEA